MKQANSLFDQLNIDLFCQENAIDYLALYGSYARGDQKKDSDVDLLVSFDKSIGLLELIEVEQKLSKLLGKKVDLVTKKGLSRYVRPYITDDLKILYAEKS